MSNFLELKSYLNTFDSVNIVNAVNIETNYIHDWSNFQSYFASNYIKINNQIEFVSVLKNLFENNVPFKILGSFHSCSNITESLAYYLNIDYLNNIIIEDDYIKCDAGVTLENLLSTLHGTGLRLSAVGGVTHQTIGGFLSTNTMPASYKHTIDDCIISYETYEYDYERKKIFIKKHVYDNTAFVGMGFKDIIKSVTFKRVKDCKYKVVEKMIKNEEFIKFYESYNSEYDFWRVNYVPSINKHLFWGAKETDSSEIKNYNDGDTNLLNWISKILYKIGKYPNKNQKDLIFNLMALGYIKEHNYYGFFKDMIPRDQDVKLKVSMAEWFFREEDFIFVFELLKPFMFRNEFFIPTEIEPIKSTKIKLSPAYSLKTVFFYKFNFMFSEYQNKNITINALQTIWNILIDHKVFFRFHYGKLHFGTYKRMCEIFDIKDLEAFKGDCKKLLKNKYYYNLFK